MLRSWTTALILSCGIFGSITVQSNEAETVSLVESTAHYEFHSHFWLNLHHYLYALGKRPPERPLESTRGLTPEEIKTLADSARWYRENLGEKDLLLDQMMYRIKRSLIQFGPDDVPQDPMISEDHQQALLAAKPIYARYFWRKHDLQNRETVAWHRDRLLKHEQGIFNRIAELAQNSWPENRIRVDLTWHANWAGAYCTVDPIHAVITSRNGGPQNTWSPLGWFELVFHEPSHALIGDDDSAVSMAIAKAADGLGVEPPGMLWHALLFYFSGSAVREALVSDGVDMELLMVSDDIFSRYHRVVFEHMPSYLEGTSTLDAAVLEIVKALKTD
jgi:hypothetical protein